MTETLLLDPIVMDQDLEHASLALVPKKATEKAANAAAAIGGLFLLGAIGAAIFLLGGDEQAPTIDTSSIPPEHLELAPLVWQNVPTRVIRLGDFYHQTWEGEPRLERVLWMEKHKISNEYHTVDIHIGEVEDGELVVEELSLKIEVNGDCTRVNVYQWDEEDEWEFVFSCETNDNDHIQDQLAKMASYPRLLSLGARDWVADTVWSKIRSTIATIIALPENADKPGAQPIVELITRYPDPDHALSTIFDLDSMDWIIDDFSILRVSPDHWILNGDDDFDTDELTEHFIEIFDAPTGQAIVDLLEAELPVPLDIKVDDYRVVSMDRVMDGFKSLAWKINGDLYFLRAKYDGEDGAGDTVAILQGFGGIRKKVPEATFSDWIRDELLSQFGHIPFLEEYADEIVQFVENELIELLEDQKADSR